MLITEKQIIQLMQVSELYLETMKELKAFNIEVSESAKNNKKNVQILLKEITDQQSNELKEVE